LKILPTAKNVAIGLLAMAALAMASTYAYRHRPPSEHDIKAVSNMTEHLQTHCFGRYLIDLPPGLVPVGFSEAAFFIGLDADHDLLYIRSPKSGLSKEQFKAQTQAAIAKWDEKLEFLMPGDPPTKLAKVIPYGDEVLLHTRLQSKGAYDLRYLGYRDGTSFELVRTSTGEDEITEGTSRLLDLSQRTTRIQNPEKSGPGSCFDDLLVSGRYDEESIDLYFENPQKPGLRVRVVFAGIEDQDKESMFQRGRTAEARFGVSVPTYLSKSYDFQGMTANEEGFSFPSETENGKINYTFQFETRRENGSIRRPLMRVIMEFGPYVEGKKIGTDLAQGETKALWEAVIKTLRPRPGAMFRRAEWPR
jgi:hypothetical protein